MIYFNRPVKTRDGRSARIICRDRINSIFGSKDLVVLVTNHQGTEDLIAYTQEGKYIRDGYPSQMDLVQEPFVVERWGAMHDTRLCDVTYSKDPGELSQGYRKVKLKITVVEE